MTPYMPISSPEQMGLPSKAIHHLLLGLEKDQIPMHSLLLARHGHLIFEGYYAPYTSHTLHRMFSITKSLVSLAVGCLEAEGLLMLDDPICSYFPELLLPEVHPFLAETTIRHMLEMKTCHSKTTYDKSSTTKNWVESFFITKPTHPPGRIFLYDTSATHVLCALAEKLSRMNLLDYLRRKFLDEIGFSKEAYVIKDPFETSMGGSGLMAYPSDLMRLGILMMKLGGRKSDQDLDPDSCSVTGFPRDYFNKAIACHGATIMSGPISEERHGYGYQFWNISHRGYACYGMGGQLILCYPDQDLICVTTADTQDIKGGCQLIYNHIYEDIFPCLSEPPLPRNPAFRNDQLALRAQAHRLTLPVLPASPLFIPVPLQAALSGKIWQLECNDQGFTHISVTWIGDGLAALTYRKQGTLFSHQFSFGSLVNGLLQPYRQRYAASACWLDHKTLYIRFWLIDECTSSIHFQLCFTGETIVVFMKNTDETRFPDFKGFLTGH